MAAVGFAVVLFILAEMWWFFLREKPATVLPGASQELLPPPQPLRPLLPEPPEAEQEPIGTSTPVEAVLPETLLVYDRTEVVVAELPKPSDIAKAIKDFDFESVAQGELVRIAVKAPPNVVIPENPAVETSSAPLLISRDELFKTLALKMPSGAIGQMSEDYDLFAFGGNSFDQDECQNKKIVSPDCYGARLGLAVKVLDSIKLSSVLKTWEKTMAADLRPLILAKPSSVAGVFQTGMYRGQTIRYKNMPLHTITIDYGIVGDTFLVTTSKSSMLKAIDALLAAPAK